MKARDMMYLESLNVKQLIRLHGKIIRKTTLTSQRRNSIEMYIFRLVVSIQSI